MEERFLKTELNYNPRRRRERGRPGEAGEIYEVGTSNNAQKIK